MVIRKRLKIRGPALAFVTTTVTDWIPVFQNEQAAIIAIAQLKETIKYFKASMAGYVLMPSHLHILMGLSEIELLSKFVQSFKSLSSRKLKQLNRRDIQTRLYKNGAFRLWKQRFDDIIITSEEQYNIKLNYIHNNPVKTGLVSKASDYRFSSASVWETDEPGLIEIDKDLKWI